MIDAHACKKLTRSLQKFGLVEPIVWNERTGHVVGGHQRLKILDDLEAHPDYRLTVAAIDVEESEEKKLNILLNNRSAQGDWDPARLETLVLELGQGDAEAGLDMGFDPIELHLICEAEEFGTVLSDKHDKATTTVNQIREIEEKGRQKMAVADSADHYFVLVFSSGERLAAFRKAVGVRSDAEYVNGSRFQHLGEKVS